MWRYACPVAIHWGDEWEPLLRPLLPSGPGILIHYPGFPAAAAAALPAGTPAYDRVEANPTPAQVQRALDAALPLRPRWIVAVGGGSVLDTAKLVRLALACRCPSVEALLREVPEPGSERPLLVAVPTTHGTGAELTMWSTVWDVASGRKLSLSHPANAPDVAAYCPMLTSGLPLPASLAATLDALAHALEALWNRSANPVSDEMALAAVGRIAADLERLDDPAPLAVRAALLRASMFAGLAFAGTRTAAAHSISYPLTLRLGIPHGIACAMTLPALWRINAPHMAAKAERLRRRLGGEDPAAMLERLRRFAAGRVPFTLSAYGARPRDVGDLAQASFTKGRMENNLVDLDEAAVRAILSGILG
jgi:alcohol dehydrogenase